MDGGIEFLQTGKCHSLYIKVNGTVEELYGIFYQSLVLGVTHTSRIDHTAVIFGKAAKSSLMTGSLRSLRVTAAFQIVGDDSRRNTFKILNGILACLYQVFLALRPYGFAVGIMAERKDGNKYLGFLRLARHFINNFKSVTGKVNIHLLCGIVLYMTDNLNVKPVFADNPFEGRQLIAVRIFGMVLLEQFRTLIPLRDRRDTYPGSKASNSILWMKAPDAGYPCSRTVHPTVHWAGKEAVQYSCRLKGISGHICGLYYGKYET